MDELKKINKILIKESEIATLKKYDIVVSNYASIDEVLFQIDLIIDEVADEEYEELDYIASCLMERKYYGETHK